MADRSYSGMTYARKITIGSRSADIYLDREAASELCKCLITFLNSSSKRQVELTTHYVPLEEPIIVGHGRGKGARIRPRRRKGYELTVTNLP